MKLYVSVNSTDDYHNMQFILQASGINSAMSKAHMVVKKYKSGYDLDSIQVSIKPDVHTIPQIYQCRVTASKRGVYGRVGARIARTMVGGYGMTYIVDIHV